MVFKKQSAVVFLIFSVFLNIACVSNYPRVEQDITTYDTQIAKMNQNMSSQLPNIKNPDWIKSKLDHMFEVDQYMRNFWNTPHTNNYSKDERDAFNAKFILRSNELDQKNTSDLKMMLEKNDWFKINEFGTKADNQGWLIVQHADQDPEFQKIILARLEKLWPLGQSKPANYAYLYDRVASSPNDQSKMKPQRYGTQGRCTAPGQWQPWPIEDEANVDLRRKKLGMDTMAEYQLLFKDICH